MSINQECTTYFDEDTIYEVVYEVENGKYSCKQETGSDVAIAIWGPAHVWKECSLFSVCACVVQWTGVFFLVLSSSCEYYKRSECVQLSGCWVREIGSRACCLLLRFVNGCCKNKNDLQVKANWQSHGFWRKYSDKVVWVQLKIMLFCQQLKVQTNSWRNLEIYGTFFQFTVSLRFEEQNSSSLSTGMQISILQEGTISSLSTRTDTNQERDYLIWKQQHKRWRRDLMVNLWWFRGLFDAIHFVLTGNCLAPLSTANMTAGAAPSKSAVQSSQPKANPVYNVVANKATLKEDQDKKIGMHRPSLGLKDSGSSVTLSFMVEDIDNFAFGTGMLAERRWNITLQYLPAVEKRTPHIRKGVTS